MRKEAERQARVVTTRSAEKNLGRKGFSTSDLQNLRVRHVAAKGKLSIAIAPIKCGIRMCLSLPVMYC